MLVAELALPHGTPPPGTCVVPGVVSARPVLRAGDRALAAALCCPAATGVLVRTTAAWVWTRDTSLAPARLDLATFPGAPPLPGPRPDGRPHALPVRRVRPDLRAGWTSARGVPVTDPLTTAVDCARLPEVDVARRCVRALTDRCGVDPSELAERLRTRGGRAGQSTATSRWTPLVTR